MAKKLSPKQKKIAGAASPTNKITGADFKALKKGKSKPMSMKGMSPKQKAAFEKADKKMDKKKPSAKEDVKMDKALAKKVKKK